MKKIILFGSLSVTLLMGCSLFEADRKANEVAGYLKTQDYLPDQRAAAYVSAPSNSIAPKPFLVRESWMSIPVDPLDARGGIPIHQAISHVLRGTNLRVMYGDGATPNANIHVSLGGDVESSLNAISYASGQSYQVDGDVVNWTLHVTKMFKVPVLNADYEYSVGNTGESNKSSNSLAGDVSQSGGASTEYSSQKSAAHNAYDEFELIANSIIGEEGYVVPSKTSGGLVVTTTLSRMKLLEKQFSEITKSMLRQVGLEIQLIRFTSNTNSGGAINWSAVRDQANGLLQFNGGIAEGSALNNIPISFSATRATGKSSGSEVLVEILEKQGSVTVSSRPTITSQINRIARLDLTRDIHFVSRTEVQQGYNTIGGSEPIASMEQSVIRDGVNMYAMANITDEDNIILLLSSSLFELENLAKKTSFRSEVESPTLLKNEISNTVIAANGETIIVGGLITENSKGEQESPTGLPFLKTKKTSEKKRTELILLVTPIIIEPPKRY